MRNTLLKIKNIAIVLLLSISAGCEDPIDVTVPNGPSRLVVDASFEVFINEASMTKEVNGGVRLTVSAPFFDKDVTPVRDAIVTIRNTKNNTIIDFEEFAEPGFYSPIDFFDPEFDTNYELTILYNTETYRAITQLIPTVPIDTIVQGDRVLFEGDETEVIVSFTDDGSRDDFYLFDFDFDLYLASEDRFYQGKTFSFSFFYENNITNKDLTIKIYGIDEQFYKYSTLLLEQSESEGGDPFSSPPSVLRGNVQNNTNPENYPLGYFSISEANSFEVTIQ